MSYTFYCPRCGQKLESDDDWGGEETTCPACGQTITVPIPIVPQTNTTPKKLKKTFWRIMLVSGGICLLFGVLVTQVYNHTKDGQKKQTYKNGETTENTKDAETYTKEAEEHFHSGDLDKAVKTLRMGVEQYPNNPRLYLSLAGGYLHLEDWENARKAVEKTVDLNPDSSDSGFWHGIGIVYSALEDWENAIKAFEKAVRLNPDNSKCWHQLGVAFKVVGEFTQARNALRKSLTLDSENPLAWHNIGFVYMDLGDYNNAKNAFEENIKLNPDSEKDNAVLIPLGMTYFAEGEYEKSQQVMMRVVTLDPDLSMAWLILGSTYIELGQYTDAITALKRSADLDPKNIETWQKLKYCYFVAGEIEALHEASRRIEFLKSR